MRGVSGAEWRVLSDLISPSEDLVKKYGRILAQLIVNRGYEEDEEAFLEPKLKNLLPYTLLPNVEEGVDRIVRAVRKKERIIIFGDYDVDGITGTAIIYEVLKEAGARVVPLLPTRGSGYGLNDDLMKTLSRYGDLLITVDNGTSAVDEIEKSSMDVVIIDHHNIPPKTPEKAILINPKTSSEVPKDMKELSSSAMSFYIALALVRELGLDYDVRRLLDLVSLGTIGDVMPLNVTNRILVTKGLRLMEYIMAGGMDKAGIRALLESAGLRGRITARDIAFSLAPRINAPGRVGDPKLALELLLERDRDRARQIARKIEGINAKRRNLTDAVIREARKKLKAVEDMNFVTLWDEGWHAGVIGIVAGRLSSLVQKPVAVFTKGGERAVGSVRSVEGIDVYEGLKDLSHMFIKWGGHSQAVGITIRSDLLDEFRDRANEVFSHLERDLQPLEIDMELPTRDLSAEVHRSIDRLEPYGEGNPHPVFLSEPLKIRSLVAKNGRSLVRAGDKEFLCWDIDLIEGLSVGEDRRFAYSIVKGKLHLIDIEDRNGTG